MERRYTKKEISQFFKDYPDGVWMFWNASNDYAAARCCILNRLVSGYRLASEAIEKLIKAAICFEMKRMPKWGNFDPHHTFHLKEKLKSIRDYNLDTHDEQLNKLYDHYQSRYHDNKLTGKGSISTELNEIDEIWMKIVEMLPVPKEFLYSNYFFHQLCSNDPYPHRNDGAWYKEQNLTLLPKLHEIKKEYDKFNIN